MRISWRVARVLIFSAASAVPGWGAKFFRPTKSRRSADSSANSIGSLRISNYSIAKSPRAGSKTHPSSGF
jgi:hypothetical protein